jgi:hypothetical protein
MSNQIVELVKEEVEIFNQARLQEPAMFPRLHNLYPIPFFGDIRHAEVLIVALIQP